MLRRVLKWITVLSWVLASLTFFLAVFHYMRGDEFGYAAFGELTVILANIAVAISCVYLLIVFVGKRFIDRKHGSELKDE